MQMMCILYIQLIYLFYYLLHAVQDLDKGDTIFINDGTVKLEVEGKEVANNQLYVKKDRW